MKTRDLKDHVAVQMYRDLCSVVSSDYAVAASKGVLENGLNALARVDPSAYSTASAFRDDYMLQTFLSKYTGLADEQALTKKAAEDFVALESDVELVNKRLKSIVPDAEGILSYARRKIESILERALPRGDRRDMSFPFGSFLDAVEWGPGASSTIPRRHATIDKKMLEPRLSVTKSALRYARAYLQQDLGWLRARLGPSVEGPASLLPSEFEVSNHDVFDTVVKSFKQRRVILKQPTLNLFLQKSVGRVIRRCLKSEYIDLDDQSRNQRIARRAFAAHYATIDLASASDTIASELVRLLLPPAWFEVLDDLRTKTTLINGKEHRLAKFSAMGNGFTFELESLIFYALSWAVVRAEGDDFRSRVAVYGDDIIVHQRHAKRLISVLQGLGFRVNLEKSFTEGDFYESCGKHFFKGVDVTPIYQKEEIGDIASSIRAHNRLLRWLERVGEGQFYDARFELVVKNVRLFAEDCVSSLNESRHSNFIRLNRSRTRKIFKPLRLPVQPVFVEGDGGLIELDASQFRFDENGICRVVLLRDEPIKVEADNGALLATALRRSNGRQLHSLSFLAPDTANSHEFGGMVISKDATVRTFRTEKVYWREHKALAWATLVR